jgi:hypothetical protein
VRGGQLRPKHTLHPATVGNYQCACNTGYAGSVDQNKSPMICTVSVLQHLRHAHAVVVNIILSRACVDGHKAAASSDQPLSPTFRWIEQVCAPVQDIDECAGVNCGPNARCTQPTVGNFQCVCNAGYAGSIVKNKSPLVCTVSMFHDLRHAHAAVVRVVLRCGVASMATKAAT